MKSSLILLLFSVVGVFSLSPGAFSKFAAPDWETLFNGENLDGWDTFLGRPFDKPDQAVLV